MIERLDAIGDRPLPPGTVLRFPAAWPYEDVVDLIVVAFPDGCGLVVATGYKAGLIVVILPGDAVPEGQIALSAAWLAQNWTRWVWPAGDAAEVRVLPGYDVPTLA
ncbi:Immunity protein 45 [Devosia sp. YR412]|uniref:Imm45 family immunity protein n=1 Tax=Devosia sp. YR412 TaxID=1881030 RepID=UPI0008BB2AF1|nr:Imm45 family immunity protein [Devosia sp. YR412]SEP66218.1 Immunity protein 45 [Devosia sp. YR412]